MRKNAAELPRRLLRSGTGNVQIPAKRREDSEMSGVVIPK